MEPTLLGLDRDTASAGYGDWVLVSRTAYWWGTPERWDVVVFDSEDSPNTPRRSVKRVVGLPGETVDLRAGDLWVNGRPLELPATVSGARLTTRWPQLPLTLAGDELFVLGDNTYLSQDSRQSGPVAVEALRGRVFCIVSPPGRWGFLP